MATLDTSATYTLSNMFTGPGKLLAVPSDPGSGTKPELLSATTNTPPNHAQWFLTSTDLDPFYRLHTVSGGESLSLDVINSGGESASSDLHMAATGRYSGQYWRFDEWQASDGTSFIYRISNNFTGLEKHLDVYSDTLVPFLTGGDFTGQHWRVEVVDSKTGTGTGTGTGSAATEEEITDHDGRDRLRG
ncbi:hypothetical protein B0T16DRAFT_435556 [Cercophora newfieldiana]|uniref:Ricin B lectin domain-containing protein n=1 Tax=Cercophora newfieldiana TaxID=92897 RepID=A0AA40CXT5_9PEZI|nr:hypothetical protein B0T16DRAFT_435556 [Cercophora newfieldiana]